MLITVERWMDSLLKGAAVLLLLAMLVSVFLGALFRSLNIPLAWSVEMSQALLVWVGFAGLILASRRGSHIRITALIDRLSGRPRAGAEIVIQLAIAALGVVMLVKSPALIERNWDVEWVSLPLSVALIYVPVPLAGLAVIGQAATDIVRVLRGHDPRAGGQI